ncbi:MAG: type II toxin-antitoxin system HicB family antitoxin [Cyanobacterium sp. T60_A2020_053]|nr:type II toxin-antitoxin system HicB family antitoxin [Cyanobacterium sp. T60_A2020_053]
MERFNFPVNFTPEEEGGFVITFPDFPEAISQGETVTECLMEAKDCLDEALALRIDEKLEIPLPSNDRDFKYKVSPSLEMIFKVLMYLSIKESNLSVQELADQLNLDKTSLDNLINPRQNIQLSLFERIFHFLGKDISIHLISSHN